MPQLTAIQLDDGSLLYIEAEETDVAPDVPSASVPTRVEKGATQQAMKSFQAMQGTIRAYTASTLDAFKDMTTSANVEKVSLEFGIKVAGEGGVPYITKGSAECNLKITVECSFPK